MDSIEGLARANGGVISAAQLRRAGVPYSAVMELRSSTLHSIRKGWYRTEFYDTTVAAAVKNHGVISCVTALRRCGVWVPTKVGDTHIRYIGRTRPARHCQPYRRNPAVESAVDSLRVALESAANCLDAEGLVWVLDSALNQRLIDMADVRTIVQESRHAHRNLADKCDGRADSGLETIVRLRLRALGIDLDLQVPIDGVGFVDLLVGTRLVIEADGHEFHSNFAADRIRDLELHARGYLPVRLAAEQIEADWAVTVARLLRIIRSGRHRKRIDSPASQYRQPHIRPRTPTD